MDSALHTEDPAAVETVVFSVRIGAEARVKKFKEHQAQCMKLKGKAKRFFG